MAIGQVQDSLRSILRLDISTGDIQKQVEKLIVEEETKESDSLHYLYNIYAYWLYDYVGVQEAIQYEKKSFEFSKENDPENISYIQRSGTHLAFYQVNNNEIPQSIKTYKTVILLDNGSKYAITSYFKLGYSYLKLKDYYQAIKHYELSIPILKKSKNLNRLREAYQNLASTYLRIETLESYKKGRIYGLKADSLAQIIPTPSGDRYKINYLLAQLYNREEDVQFDISKKYYDRAFEIAKKENDTLKLITINLGYGILYQGTDLDTSKKYHEKTLELSKERSTFYAYQAYSNLAYIEGEKGNIEASINTRRKALKTLVGVDFKSMESNYDSIIKNTDRKTNLLYNFPRLAKSYVDWYKENKLSENLEYAIFYFELADQLIDELQKNSIEFKSKLFWRRLSNDVYDKAIETALLKGDQEKAFYYMEKNKSLLLLEDIQQQRFQEQLSPSNYLYSTQKKYQQKKGKLSSLINNSKATHKEIDSLRKELIDIEILFENANKNLLKSTGNYKTKATIASLDSVMNTLQKDELILEYHVVKEDSIGDNSKEEAIYLLAISNNKKELFKLDNPTRIRKDAELLINKIKTPFYTKEDQQQYLKIAYQLYRNLIPTEELRNQIDIKKVILIPHGFLNLLPFEALTKEEHKLEYLINSTLFEYQYSVSFLSNIAQIKPNRIHYTSFAPIEFGSQNLLSLPNSENEVDILSSKYNGQSYLRNFATKKSFLELEKKGILHLATHADTPDSISPWIAFSDEKLYLEEIYGLSTKSDLVVLSACNTSLGKEEEGEGIMSLGRGFSMLGHKAC